MEQADLVRAIESIDHSDILAHHVNITHPHQSSLDTQFQTHEVPIQSQHQQQQPEDKQQDDHIHLHQEEGKEFNDWSREQLQAEIVKLRRLAQASTNVSSLSTPSEGITPNHVELAIQAAPSTSTSQPITSFINPTITPTDQPGTAISQDALNDQAETSAKKRIKRKRLSENDGSSSTKEKKIVKRDEGTGKRLEKDRKTELAKTVRIKIRSYIGVGLDDPLPHPNTISQPGVDGGNNTEGSSMTQNTNSKIFVPDWNLQMNDETNRNWVNRISQEIYQESLAGLHPKIPTSDISPEVIDTATKTAFVNMCKRYLQENDPKGSERREKYTKKRRRWARKDLKQKRRTRTASDLAFQNLNLPPSALHIDYMSSEYSSSGEDTSGENEENLSKRKSQWEEMRRKKAEEEQPIVNGKGGWAVGISEKVLEVRTPRWRSRALNDIYKRLDAHANQFSDTRASGSNAKNLSQPTLLTTTSTSNATNIRPGHVAPSHRRFTMSSGTMRKGGTPRDLGEGWMWESGMGGVWPEEAARWIGDATFDQTPSIQNIDHVEEQPTGMSTGINEDAIPQDSLTAVLQDSRPNLIDVGIGVNAGLEALAGGNEMEEARLGLVNALEGL